MDSGKDEAVIDRDCGLRCCVNENTRREEFLDRFNLMYLVYETYHEHCICLLFWLFFYISCHIT